jgi:hypothetical protein
MRFFKVALLIQYFEISKNKKKALLFINIGIFLSIFALSSAFISIYIENKVNNFEYEHADLSYQKDYYQKIQTLLPVLSGSMNQADTIERDNDLFTTFIKLNAFGNRIISTEDIHLPIIFNKEQILDEILEFINEFSEDPDLELTLKTYFTKEDAEEYLKMFKNFDKQIFKQITAEERKGYKDIIYESSDYTLLRQTIRFDNLNIYSGKFFNQSKEAQAQIREIKKFVEFLNHFNVIYLFDLDSQIDEINKKITLYSSYENRIIIIAFLLQLIVFIIIQFFEVSSINLARSKKLKRPQ